MKIEFEKPIVRANLDRITFPQQCPVCGVRSDSVTKITAIPGREQYLRPSWDPRLSASTRRLAGISELEKKTLMVPVCQDHKYEAEDECRSRILCVVSDGTLMAVALFAVFNITNDLSLSRMTGFWAYASIGLFALSLGLTYFVFRPRPIERAVRIVGFDNGFQYVWLEIEKEEYRDAFLEENKIHAELISWIMKA
jgi:hypothetical protein